MYTMPEHKATKGEEKPLAKSRIRWSNAIVMLTIHTLALYGFYRVFMEPINIVLLFFGFQYAQIGGRGITMGAHRLFAHKTYKAKPALKFFLLIAQASAGQNSMYTWVRDHRQHHKYSDTVYDPHNAKRGFFYSHIGWLITKKHPEVIAKRKAIDMSDLENDPLIIWQHKYLLHLFFLTGVLIPAGLGYMIDNDLVDVLLICVFVKQVLLWNFTWLVNSWAHFFGNKPYTTDMVPYEAHLVSALTAGEGWHNFHHTFPYDYRAGEIMSRTTFYIELAARWGLAYDLRTASDEMIERRAANHGDGSRKQHLEKHGGRHPPAKEAEVWGARAARGTLFTDD